MRHAVHQTKKLPAINRVSEWSSVPNILEPNNQWFSLFFGGLFNDFLICLVNNKNLKKLLHKTKAIIKSPFKGFLFCYISLN